MTSAPSPFTDKSFEAASQAVMNSHRDGGAIGQGIVVAMAGGSVIWAMGVYIAAHLLG
jgi:hypothetical protein